MIIFLIKHSYAALPGDFAMDKMLFSIDLLNYVDKDLQAMSFQRQHNIFQAYLSTNRRHENIYHLIFSKKI